MATKKTAKKAAKATAKKTAAENILAVRTEDMEFPTGDDPKHLFQVTLVVLADRNCSLEQVLNHVTAGCLRHPNSLPVVNGYGTAVKNLTLSNRKDRSRFRSSTGVVCTHVVAKKVDPKRTIPVIHKVS